MASIFKGAVAEQFVGQELILLQSPLTRAGLYYWAREAKNSSAEVDYLTAIKGNVVPIEVKSGKSNKMISLKMFMNKYNSERGFRISQDAYTKNGNIINIPFYCLSALYNFEKQELQ